jgi:hypothetical protein
MLRVVQYHTISLPKGWPRRVRSAVIQVISLARAARRITPSVDRSWPSRYRIISLVHYTRGRFCCRWLSGSRFSRFG